MHLPFLSGCVFVVGNTGTTESSAPPIELGKAYKMLLPREVTGGAETTAAWSWKTYKITGITTSGGWVKVSATERVVVRVKQENSKDFGSEEADKETWINPAHIAQIKLIETEKKKE